MQQVVLSDGRTVELKINFLTLKLLATNKNLKQLDKDLESDDVDVQFDALGSLLHSILRSNGVSVTVDEALALLPLEDESFFEMIDETRKQLESFKKKMEARKTFYQNQLTKK